MARAVRGPFTGAIAAVLLAVALIADASAGAAPTWSAARITSKLTVRQLAGQRIIYGYEGLKPPGALLRAIRAGDAAGVIFFSQNISSKAQLRGVAEELQRAAAHSPVKLPLLLMTDQEGGEVRRLPGAPIYSEKQIGASSNPASAARRAGRGAGLNVRGAGLNVNLAPVLDVYRTEGNFIDEYGRSYSNNPRTVSKLGAAFIVKQQQTGVAATAKHFPGLGAAARGQDTDTGPVTLRVSRRKLREVDELPYQSAIAAGVKLVMVSWARYPALDSRMPAGLSPAIVQQELRRRLGFRGVTITDALGAGALRSFGGASHRAVLAAGAGMDLLLCSDPVNGPASPGQAGPALSGLASALHGGRLRRGSFLAAVDRVLELRHGLAG